MLFLLPYKFVYQLIKSPLLVDNELIMPNEAIYISKVSSDIIILLNIKGKTLFYYNYENYQNSSTRDEKYFKKIKGELSC